MLYLCPFSLIVQRYHNILAGNVKPLPRSFRFVLRSRPDGRRGGTGFGDDSILVRAIVICLTCLIAFSKITTINYVQSVSAYAEGSFGNVGINKCVRWTPNAFGVLRRIPPKK